MILFVIASEPLIYKTNSNKQIQGIRVTNINEPIKTIPRADNLTAIITTNIPYSELKHEVSNYSNIAGSKVNNNKTEILRKGEFQSIEKEYVKNNIKVLVCM